MSSNNVCVVFDLDDTLYYEIDFVKSAYRHIAKVIDPGNHESLYNKMFSMFLKSEDVFEWLLTTYSGNTSLNMAFLINEYRYHLPELVLEEDTRILLDKLKEKGCFTGLITDGRAISQRNKLVSLGLDNYFDLVIISEEVGTEKPDIKNYQPFNDAFPGAGIAYVADNTRKDFITPNQMGWSTFCLKCKGQNIHKQDLAQLPPETILISNLSDILAYL